MTLAALIIFSTVLPLLLMAEGVRRVGASRAALISTLGPPATAIMAYYLTGEMTHSQPASGDSASHYRGAVPRTRTLAPLLSAVQQQFLSVSWYFG